MPAAAALLFFSATGGAGAASPPDSVNYQGVLRSSAGAPLTGSYDMVFRFFDAAAGGNEILLDRHEAAGSGAVTVSGGLFNVPLGSGTVVDGAGPGTYASLAAVTADYGDAWLEILVNGETLSPRVHLLSSPYALNAQSLQGRPAASFIDNSAIDQTKAGAFTAFTTVPSGIGLTGYGAEAGGLFSGIGTSGFAYVGVGDYGIEAFGNAAGGFFKESDTGGQTFLASNGVGVDALGVSMGGKFTTGAGGSEADLATGVRGVEGYGTQAGGYFKDSDNTGQAWVGLGDYGIEATGSNAGGLFIQNFGSGYTRIAIQDRGIIAQGNTAGGEFNDGNASGHALVGSGNDGIFAEGTEMGGLFSDSDGSGVAFAGIGDVGVWSKGDEEGGLFQAANASGYARVGYGDYGIAGLGSAAGGSFFDLNNSGLAYVGYGDRGIWGKGTFAGGTFSHPDNVTFWADVATPTRKIQGTGTVSFVQNHPYEKDRSIVYAAPEGDEVAVYTRGTARLVGGEARVSLGETFKWVADPDLGLTAHLTPRDRAVPLAVASLSTEEMVVRGPEGASDEVAFDYIVYGLRIGFEDLPVVQPKEREAFLPAAEDVTKAYEGAPALRSYSAGERFRRMSAAAGLVSTGRPAGAAFSPRARDLAAAINAGRDRALAEARRLADEDRAREAAPRADAALPASAAPHPGPAPEASAAPPASAAPAASAAPQSPSGPAASPAAPRVSSLPVLPVSGVVRTGDVLVMDPGDAGTLRAAVAAFDATVAGCAVPAEEGVEVPPGHAAVALTGVVLCRVDASAEPIRIGDPLTTSANPGHAMRAGDAPAGAILGKAMEPVAAGTALIRVLVTLR
jgi:hypothetical protein